MLVITSNRLSNSRKTRRQVHYQPEDKKDPPTSMSDALRKSREQDDKRQVSLERRFKDKLRNTANGWYYSYREG